MPLRQRKERGLIDQTFELACSLIVRSQHWHQSSINWSNVATGTALITQRRVKNTRSATYNAPLCRVLLIKRRRLGMWQNQNCESGKAFQETLGCASVTKVCKIHRVKKFGRGLIERNFYQLLCFVMYSPTTHYQQTTHLSLP